MSGKGGGVHGLLCQELSKDHEASVPYVQSSSQLNLVLSHAAERNASVCHELLRN